MKIIGHRGAAAVAPENTMASFATAWQAGADGVELDVRLSSDGEVVVVHDMDGLRLARVAEAVASSPWSSIRTWRMRGEPVPLLAEVLGAAPAGTLTLVEIKSGLPVIDKLLPLFNLPRLSDVGILSFDLEVVAMARRRFPGIAVLLNVEPEQMNGLDALMAFAVKEELAGLSVGWSRAMNKDVVDGIKARGLSCAVWTVNDPATARLALDYGVDLLMTDHPAMMLAQVRHG